MNEYSSLNSYNGFRQLSASNFAFVLKISRIKDGGGREGERGERGGVRDGGREGGREGGRKSDKK